MDVQGMTLELHGLEHWSKALDNALASEDMQDFSEDEIYEAAPQRLPFALWRFVNHVCDRYTDLVSDHESHFSGVQVGPYYVVIHGIEWLMEADGWAPEKALREWRYAALAILQYALSTDSWQYELGAWWFQAGGYGRRVGKEMVEALDLWEKADAARRDENPDPRLLALLAEDSDGGMGEYDEFLPEPLMIMSRDYDATWFPRAVVEDEHTVVVWDQMSSGRGGC